MAKYVDGFVIVVPNDKAEDYKKMATEGAETWMRHGALDYYECQGEDMHQQEMGDIKTRAFPEMAGAGENETVWFSFIVFESREHRDEVNAKVMAEMEQQPQDPNMVMPFEMKRMAYGGFEVAVQG